MREDGRTRRRVGPIAADPPIREPCMAFIHAHRKGAAEFLKKHKELHVGMLNAGIMALPKARGSEHCRHDALCARLCVRPSLFAFAA